MSFNTVKFIADKRNGKIHSETELSEFIGSISAGLIPDYQITAWLMAACINGLSFDETLAMTSAMAHSGKVLRWEKGRSPVVDKHSTGGVGDTVTLILAPLVASMGMRIGKHSGRGLGHTGGTIDKLESIPGFRTSLSENEFVNIVNTVGCAVAGQDKDMTPADGILYSLRDVTATVDNESLIAASIMSKKLAGGAGSILLDVKIGSGAFMKDIESAKSLADLMVKVGLASGVNTRARLSFMDEPLGRAIGNALEVKEAIRILKNESVPNDNLRHICIEFASELAGMSGIADIRSARSLAMLKLENGEALERFQSMISAQGGRIDFVEKYDKILPLSAKVFEIQSDTTGYISRIDALKLGELVRDLGGGRYRKTDQIDMSVGIILYKKTGDAVLKGETVLELHSNGKISDDESISRARSSIEISEIKPEPLPLFV